MSNNAIQAADSANTVTQQLLLDYLKTLNSGFNDAQIMQFCAVAQAFGLNPFKREIYAVPYKDKDGNVTMSIVTGYESYIKRAEMCPAYDGFNVQINGKFSWQTITKKGRNGNYDVQALAPEGEVSCTCTVYRKDRTHPFVETVYFDEYNQNNSMWQTKPRTMLKKVAIVSAFRKAFPLDFGGMPYTNDELPDKMTAPEQIHAEVVEETAPQQPAIAADKPVSKQKLLKFATWSEEQKDRVGVDLYNITLQRMGGEEKVLSSTGNLKSFTDAIGSLPDAPKEEPQGNPDQEEMF